MNAANEDLVDKLERETKKRVRRELGKSVELTSVADNSALFEAVTNSHFNRRMNEEAELENMSLDRITSQAGARKALNNLRSMIRLGQPSPALHSAASMGRKDFSRKLNSFGPVLVNNSYSGFRFAKRSTDKQLGPLDHSRSSRLGNTRRQTQVVTQPVDREAGQKSRQSVL